MPMFRNSGLATVAGETLKMLRITSVVISSRHVE